MVTLIIPTYRERESIEPLLARVGGIVPQLSEPLEVLVIDNCSGDGTAEAARRMLGAGLQGDVIECAQPVELAQAVMQAARHARGDVLAVMDADLSHPPECLPDLVRQVRSGAQVAVASRYVAGGRIAQWTWCRRALSRAGNLLAQPLTGVRDATSGYFACPAPLLQSLDSHPKGFKILLELLVRTGVQRIAEVPYTFTDRVHGTSKLQLWVLWRYLVQLASLYLRSGSPAPQPAGRARLSVVLITKDEERQIARCLESAKWADELIVVDGLSIDRTVEICRQYGATVISHAFCGDFGHERNLGNEAATGDWILQLDADDTVSPQLRASIERILRDGSPHDAFKFRRRNWFLGHPMRHGGWYHYYPHFFRRGRAHFEGRVHHLLKSAQPPAILSGDLEHRPFESIEQFISRHNRYTALEAEELFQRHGAPPRAVLRSQMLQRPLKLFWKTYVKKQGFREGWHGLVFSLLFAGVHFLKWAKYWEQGLINQPAPPEARNGGPAPPPPRTRTATLSVALMTKNEEARLASCLERVAGWVDDIVVIDDYSTDRTAEIARRYTDQVFLFASDDNHDGQWNRGIERARGEWVLHIDADEIVTPKLQAAIDDALSGPGEYDAFELMRKNFFLGHPMRYGGWYHRHLVLFRKDRARCVGNGIHVQLNVNGAIGFLNAELEHHPFSSLTQFLDRQNHYTTVEVRRRFEREGPVPARVLVYQLVWRPVKLFWKSYVKNEGRREGAYGLVFGLLYAFVHVIWWAKYWDLSARQPAAPVPSGSIMSQESRGAAQESSCAS